MIAGQTVAELDDLDARIGLSKAEANYAVRAAEFDAAKGNWDNPIKLEETLKTAQAEKARLEAEKTKFQRQAEFSHKQAEISKVLGLRGADSALRGRQSCSGS